MLKTWPNCIVFIYRQWLGLKYIMELLARWTSRYTIQPEPSGFQLSLISRDIFITERLNFQDKARRNKHDKFNCFKIENLGIHWII